MPIKTSCPACNKVYTLDEAYAGKQVRCKSCGSPFWVKERDKPANHEEEEIPTAEVVGEPRRRSSAVAVKARRLDRDEDDDRPRGRSRDWDDDDDDEDEDEDDRPRPRRKRRSGPSTGLVIGLIAGGFCLLLSLGVAVAIFSLRSVSMGGAGAAPAVANLPAIANPPINPIVQPEPPAFLPRPRNRGMNAPPVNAGDQPPAGFPAPLGKPTWSQLQIGMTEQQVIDRFGQPLQSRSLEGIDVIHANVTQDEVMGPDGKTRPVKWFRYLKGSGEAGFVDVTFVDGKVFKVKK